MPQMAPIYWLVMMMYFILIMMILIMYIFFFFEILPQKSSTMTNFNNSMNWMW